jgi:hypothetical protein
MCRRSERSGNGWEVRGTDWPEKIALLTIFLFAFFGFAVILLF